MSSAQQRRRRPLLSAAAELFARRGYTATSVDHLIEATGLEPASFSQRFSDRQGCFLAAYDQLIAVASCRLTATLRTEQPWPERVASGLWTVLELIDANPAAARLVLVESQFAGRPARERYTAAVERLAAFMREGRQSPTAPERLPPTIDSVLPAGVAFSLGQRLRCNEPASPLYAELLRFLLLPYLGEAETTDFIAARSGSGEFGGKA